MSGLSHLDSEGAARMVDVSGKPDSAREAIAEGFIAMAPEVIAAIRAGDIKKGDVLGAARVAGIMAAKRTSGKTGVEMEALTAASTALLTIYDMAKAIDKGMTIGPLRLLAKSGGKSGEWLAKDT